MMGSPLPLVHDHVADAGGPSPRPSLHLDLHVTDSDVVLELQRHPEGDERQRYALAALRLGVTSLRTARGDLDATAVREAGEKLLSDIRDLLTTRAAGLSHQMATTLAQYFDPHTGALPQRLRALLEQGGELERLLRSHFGPDESLLARTMAAHLGDGSPLFRMLSPADKQGLRAQVAETLQVALTEQRNLVLREFSLDNRDSALHRLLGEIDSSQGRLEAHVTGQVDSLVKEFSLDHPDSALSRLVGKVDATQKAIAEEFSVDNASSALSRLSRLLENTSEQVGRNLTLDDADSALARLRKELLATIDGMVRGNQDFHSEVRVTLASLQARREEAARSTRHGATFEAQLGDVLAAEAQRAGDLHHATGTIVGSIRNCKTGDYVTELGPDSSAARALIVWEAKEDKRYDLVAALEEMEVARRNREAGVGVFVFSKNTAPSGLAPFARYGADIAIVWDVADPASDVYVKAAHSVGRALSIRACQQVSDSDETLRSLEELTRAVERQVQHLDQIKTWSETIRGHGEKIADRVGRMRTDLLREVERLDHQVKRFKAPPQAGNA